MVKMKVYGVVFRCDTRQEAVSLLKWLRREMWNEYKMRKRIADRFRFQTEGANGNT